MATIPDPSIEYGTRGKQLSDGQTYRVEFQGQGSGYKVFREGADNWIYAGHVYSKPGEKALTYAVEKMLRDKANDWDDSNWHPYMGAR